MPTPTVQIYICENIKLCRLVCSENFVVEKKVQECNNGV